MRIQTVFDSQHIRPRFYGGVGPDDPRIAGRPLDENTRRCWSIMYGHLDMLRLFVESGKPYAIFCEDDILVRRDFGQQLPGILANFRRLNLDVLLLGCLCSNSEFRYYSNFPELRVEEGGVFQYYGYDSNPDSAVWGTQMYLIHRGHAIHILSKYADNGYADRTISDKSLTPFSADWTITKDAPNKALIYPLVAIENYEMEYTDEGQDLCRKKSYRLFYSADTYQ